MSSTAQRETSTSATKVSGELVFGSHRWPTSWRSYGSLQMSNYRKQRRFLTVHAYTHSREHCTKFPYNLKFPRGYPGVHGLGVPDCICCRKPASMAGVQPNRANCNMFDLRYDFIIIGPEMSIDQNSIVIPQDLTITKSADNTMLK